MTSNQAKQFDTNKINILLIVLIFGWKLILIDVIESGFSIHKGLDNCLTLPTTNLFNINSNETSLNMFIKNLWDWVNPFLVSYGSSIEYMLCLSINWLIQWWKWLHREPYWSTSIFQHILVIFHYTINVILCVVTKHPLDIKFTSWFIYHH